MRRPKMQLPVGRSRVQRSNKPLTQEFRSYHSSRLSRDDRPVPGLDKAVTADGRRTRSHRSVSQVLTRLVAGALVVVCLYSLLVLDTAVKVSPLSTRSDAGLLRDSESYRRAAESLLRASPLNRSKITIDTAAFESKLRRDFPELEQARLSLPLMGHRPVLDVVAKRPALVLQTMQGNYVIDYSGQAIMRSSDVSGLDNLGLPRVIDDGGIEVTVGSVVLTEEALVFILDVASQLTAADLTIDTMRIPAAFNELHVQLQGIGYTIKFLTENNAAQSVGEYLALSRRLAADRAVIAEYIDLRVPERAYYK